MHALCTADDLLAADEHVTSAMTEVTRNNTRDRYVTVTPRTCEQLRVVHALRAADDLLAADEHVEAVAVGGVVGARHGVEGPDLRQQQQQHVTLLRERLRREFEPPAVGEVVRAGHGVEGANCAGAKRDTVRSCWV